MNKILILLFLLLSLGATTASAYGGWHGGGWHGGGWHGGGWHGGGWHGGGWYGGAVIYGPPVYYNAPARVKVCDDFGNCWTERVY